MGKRIEDYALIGDRHSAALVARDGAIDWLCWPHFDSDACFAALLGDERHGSWRIAPRDPPHRTWRCYRDDTLILETRHENAAGVVCVTDLMSIGTAHRAIIRQVTGEAGEVDMGLDLSLRFDYASIPPRLRAERRSMRGIVGPDLVIFRTPIDSVCKNDSIVSEFTIGVGETLSFTLQYGLSYEPEPPAIDATVSIAETARYWQEWADRFTTPTDWPEAVKRSLITLQALTDAETGGIIAAPTPSLPEVPGGDKNWDYRYTWLRDSTFALSAFLNAGYHEEARAWRDWLLRAAAGVPERLRTMYRVDGSRHIGHYDVPWLPGLEGATPVRVGNPAADQFQLDIYGEVLDSLHLCQQSGGVGRSDIGYGDQSRDRRPSRKGLGASGSRHLGITRASPAFYLLEGDGVGWDRSLSETRPNQKYVRRSRSPGAGTTTWRPASADLPRRVQHLAQQLHPIVRIRGSRREPAVASAGRIPADRADRRHDSGDRTRIA